MLVTGADMLWIRGMAKKAINIAENCALEQELQFSCKKTEIVLFTHKRNPDLGSLSMNGTKLELSNEARLLGVTLDSKLTWKPHITRITRKATTVLMHCRQIVGKTWGITPSMMKSIYTAVICQPCRMHCVFWAGRSQQKVSSEETHKGAETCLPDDFISFSWHLYWCSGNFAQHNSRLEEFLLLRQCEGHTESLLVGSGMSTQLVPLGKQKAMLMFAMRQGNSYLYCKCQLTE